MADLIAVAHTDMVPAPDGGRPTPVIIGNQRPRLWYVPPAASYEAGQEAVELSAASGLTLDDWQAWALKMSMGIVPDGRWAAFEVGMVIARQNGKTAVGEARMLAALFLTDEPLTIYSCHEFKASQEQFRRIRSVIENRRSLMKRVKTITTSHGEEAIELHPTPTLILGSGSNLVRRSVAPRLRFLARSRGSGRAFTSDLLMWDEAMILSEEQVGAAMPTLSAVYNPQLWYMGSAGDETSIQLARVRARGVRADQRRQDEEADQDGLVPRSTLVGQSAIDSLAYFEWSIDPCHEYCRKVCAVHDDLTQCGPGCTPACPNHDDPADVKSWARANPGLGIRISIEHVRREMMSMSPNGVEVAPPDTFARERLSVGNWPTDENAWAVISEGAWEACADPDSPQRQGTICIAADVTPDFSAGSIAITSMRTDGKVVGELLEGDHRSGTSWIIPRLKVLRDAAQKDHVGPCAIVIDPRATSGTLLDEAVNAGLDITLPTTNEVGQAFGVFNVAVKDKTFIHLGPDMQPELRSAVAGAAQRDIGDGAHAWARKATTVDISPLVAVTLAVWGHSKFGGRTYNVLDSVW
jgi:hypothetical protein